jgi:uncharacterized protein (DUF2141 family)
MERKSVIRSTILLTAACVLFFLGTGCTTGGDGVVGYSITVQVDKSGTSDGTIVYVSSFAAGGDLPEDEIETVSGEILGGTASVVLNKSGTGYTDGTYAIRVHIDVNGDGKLTDASGSDYIEIGEAVVSGGDTSLPVFDGPWSIYTPFFVFNNKPSTANGTEPLHMIVVSQGNTWGNYNYSHPGTSNPNPTASNGTYSMDLWAPDGPYDFHALVDMDGDYATTGGPDSGDYVYSNTGISYALGIFPNQTINSVDWTMY